MTRLPKIICLGGKKRSGKGTIRAQLEAQEGYVGLHIAEPWLREFFSRRGLDPDNWEALKHQYRPEIQAEAEVARARNPNVLLDAISERLDQAAREDKRVVVDGVRFINEAVRLRGRHNGFVLRVVVPDEVRRQRFIDAGEDLSLFDDPFEREVDLMPVQGVISGDLFPAVIPEAVRGAYLLHTNFPFPAVYPNWKEVPYGR